MVIINPNVLSHRLRSARLSLLGALFFVLAALVLSEHGSSLAPTVLTWSWQAALHSFFTGHFAFLSAAATGYIMLAKQLPWRRETWLALLLTGLLMAMAVMPAEAGIILSASLSAAVTGTLFFMATGIYLLAPKCNRHPNFAPGHAQAAAKFAEITAIALFIFSSVFYLQLTVVLNPAPLDHTLLSWDLFLFGLLPSAEAARLSLLSPVLMLLTQAHYLLLPAFMVILHLTIRTQPMPANPIAVFLSTGIFGYAIYFIMPVCGPYYYLGPTLLSSPGTLTLDMDTAGTLALANAPRNGVPSLHTAWALAIFFLTCHMSSIMRISAALVLALTLWATLALGEHYVLDLIVAVPFSVLIQALCTRASPQLKRIIAVRSATLTATALIMIAAPGHDLLPDPLLWQLFWFSLCLLSLHDFRKLLKAVSAG